MQAGPDAYVLLGLSALVGIFAAAMSFALLRFVAALRAPRRRRVGGEAVLSVDGVIPQSDTCCTSGFWALDPVAQRWRQFAAGALVWEAAGDVVFTWTGEQVDPEGFVAYRMHP